MKVHWLVLRKVFKDGLNKGIKSNNSVKLQHFMAEAIQKL